MNALYRLAAFVVVPLTLGFPVLASESDEPADVIYAGDTVTVVKDQVELGLRDKPSTVLNTGYTVRVTVVRF